MTCNIFRFYNSKISTTQHHDTLLQAIKMVNTTLASLWIDARIYISVQFKCVFLHVDVGRLETPLIDVIKGEGLGRVGAVFIHLDRSSSSLRLLSSGCHDFRKSESHGNTPSLRHTCADGTQLKGSHPRGGQMLQDKSVGGSTCTQWLDHLTDPLLGWRQRMMPLTNTPVTTKHLKKRDKGDAKSDSGILSKPTIRHVYNSSMSFSPVCWSWDSTQSHGNHSVTISVSNNRVPCTFKTAKKKSRRNGDNCLRGKRTQKLCERSGRRNVFFPNRNNKKGKSRKLLYSLPNARFLEAFGAFRLVRGMKKYHV